MIDSQMKGVQIAMNKCRCETIGLREDADVFIIEALKSEDYARNLADGKHLENQLNLLGFHPIYRRALSKDDFVCAVNEFTRSNYRFLHISCHGDMENVFIYDKDVLTYDEMATILKPNIKNARLTFSACNLGNKDFMMKLFRTKGELHSVLAPCEETFFDKASIFWNSFYTLLFRSAREASKSNSKVSISNDMIEEIVLQLCIAFKETVALGHFCPGGKTRDDDPKFCYKICNPNPWRNFYSERRA